MRKRSVTQEEKPATSLFSNICYNIVLPVIVLKQGPKIVNKFFQDYAEHAQVISLIVALAIPTIYGLYELIRYKKRNMVSVLGVVSILLTGGFALLKVEGIWFAVKEATVPLAIGIGVLISAFTKKSLIEMMLYNPSVIKVDLIEEKLKAENKLEALKKHLRFCTIILAFSFFISAALNYWLAYDIFVSGVEGEVSDETMNDMVQEMIWKGYVIIALPCMVIMIGLFVYLMKGLRSLTGMTTEELMVAGANKENADDDAESEDDSEGNQKVIDEEQST